MIRIILAAALLLGSAWPLQAHDDTTAHADEADVKLSTQQIDAGKFAVQEVRPGTIARRA
ncbi:hypothetical protein FNL55_02740 [Tardiphaga sp. vice352]|uniref:hypothetical protein n=1 Tax=unclassified Tardiphaga TaxID=2631404 RepID=UPI001163DECB|nr:MULTISPECIES: hypothetical protein [unclassified Tardiphaga]QDM14987.1 hypothetical protein FNL53_02735 [Tardiphaga sp. vice278]QDM20096.1 hypothetical protein FIU28_02205 [Tardiphaga sp. vice154]QDM25167.1 hypothetical protein FNL56_02645 [Tardiphaga sp. vice304]QDM30379.1 hypothetical protein FNL55_02740 [Tardiphaga sp. vice352]